MTQETSNSKKATGPTTGPVSFCEPELIRWYLELTREEVLKRKENEDAVHFTRAET